ncbi:MAG: Fe-Mn family superoxide dismutase [Gammaproteobacteria bacterium]|jgi:Fe-Mn family superoxide dismutase
MNPSQSGGTTRRRFLTSTTALAVTALAASAATGGEETVASPARAFAAKHQLKPLAFDASKLDGLSARLIESHWSNNYGGSVRALNAVKTQLAEALAAKDTPTFLYNGLKREHLMRNGSVILHELYFDNLGGNGRADSATRKIVAADFGSFDVWEEEFRRISTGLGGGSGWVVLAYNRSFGVLENFWMADHMHHPAGSEPLLVIDMYEHSYQMDYGAATARYVDAFFKNVDWDVVLERYQRATA